MYKKNNFHCMNRICRDYRVFLTVACGKAGYAKVFGKLPSIYYVDSYTSKDVPLAVFVQSH